MHMRHHAHSQLNLSSSQCAATPTPPHSNARRQLALQRELGAALGRHGTPVRLVGRIASVARALALLRLVKGLKKEDVVAPVDQATDGVGEVRLCVLRARLGRLVVVAA